MLWAVYTKACNLLWSAQFFILILIVTTSGAGVKLINGGPILTLLIYLMCYDLPRFVHPEDFGEKYSVEPSLCAVPSRLFSIFLGPRAGNKTPLTKIVFPALPKIY